MRFYEFSYLSFLISLVRCLTWVFCTRTVNGDFRSNIEYVNWVAIPRMKNVCRTRKLTNNTHRIPCVTIIFLKCKDHFKERTSSILTFYNTRSLSAHTYKISNIVSKHLKRSSRWLLAKSNRTQDFSFTSSKPKSLSVFDIFIHGSCVPYR